MNSDDENNFFSSFGDGSSGLNFFLEQTTTKSTFSFPEADFTVQNVEPEKSSKDSNMIMKRKRKYSSIEERIINKKLQNKEAARKTRQKKKEKFEQLEKENQALKKQISEIQSFMTALSCPNCHKELKLSFLPNETKIEASPRSSFISRVPKVFGLISSVAVLCVILSVIFPENFEVMKKKLLRNMSEKEKESFFIGGKSFELTRTQIEDKIEHVSGWYMTLGDYYSITEKGTFLDDEKYVFNNLGEIRIINEKEARLYHDKSCPNCIVKINQHSLTTNENPKGGFRFTMYLPIDKIPSYINTSRNNFLDMIKEEETLVLEVNCVAIGVSPNYIKPARYFDNKAKES